MYFYWLSLWRWLEKTDLEGVVSQWKNIEKYWKSHKDILKNKVIKNFIKKIFKKWKIPYFPMYFSTLSLWRWLEKSEVQGVVSQWKNIEKSHKDILKNKSHKGFWKSGFLKNGKSHFFTCIFLDFHYWDDLEKVTLKR